jgi:hypothetical protein
MVDEGTWGLFFTWGGLLEWAAKLAIGMVIPTPQKHFMKICMR